MAVVNAVGNALTSSTGSGAFVGATSPVLVTPTLGVASATSINFGGGALGSYVPVTSWTPVFTFATPGDLSNAYSSQQGYYDRVGDRCDFWFNLLFTPTFSTSSGNIRITGLPLTPSSNITIYVQVAQSNTNITFGASNTALVLALSGGSTIISLTSYGSGVSSATLASTNVTSGASTVIRGSGSFII